MRWFLVTVVFLTGILSTLRADPAPEQFLEIPWGANSEKVRQTITRRSDMVWDSRASSATELHYNGGSFAGLNVSRWAFAVNDRSFFHATFSVPPPADGSSAFRKLKQLIAEKYGGGREDAVGKPGAVYYDWVRGEYAQGASKKPAHGTTWTLQTSFTRQTIQISCRPEKGNGARVDYHNLTIAKPPEPATSSLKPAPPKKRDL